MTIKNKHSLSLLLLFLIVTGKSPAQEFRVKAALDAVPVTGFYKIPVTPELTGYVKYDLSDIRIATDSNVFVPYINQKNIRQNNYEVHRRMQMLSNNTEGKYTTIILERVIFDSNINDGITNLTLEMNNAVVERYTSLSGSDDKDKWYIINDSIRFSKAFKDNEGDYFQPINFPLSKYKYFKLKINNANTDPLKVNGVSTFRTYKNHDTLPATLINNPSPSFTQKDSSNHISYIIIKNNAPYLTDKISIEATGPKFYNRDVTAFILHDDKDSSTINDPVASYILSPDKPGFCVITGQKAQTIILQINNKDNPPLKVTGITTGQEAQYLIAWLGKGKAYSLLAGNTNATEPQYDLYHFKDSIPSIIPTLACGPLNNIPKNIPPVIKQSKNYWLWPTIVIAVIVLSLLTYRLMKDMKQSEN